MAILIEPGPAAARWGKDELLARANRWGKRRGYAPMTEANWRELIKEGVLPTATFRGRGYGRGHDAYWSLTTYRRLLRVMTLRHNGARLRWYQRVVLWLEGADLPVATVREDLAKWARLAMEQGVHRELQSDRQVGRYLTSSQRKSLSQILSPGNDVNLTLLNLNGETLRASLSVIARHASIPTAHIERIIGDAAEVMVGYREGLSADDIRTAAPSAHLLTPASIDGLAADITDAQGIMGRPKDGENAILDALANADDALLLNVRDSLRRLEATYRALLYSLRRIVERDATELGSFAPLQEPIVRLLREFENVRLFSDPKARFSMFCFFLVRASRRGDNGEGLRRFFVDLRLDILLPLFIDHADELADGGLSSLERALATMRLTDAERERIMDILSTVS